MKQYCYRHLGLVAAVLVGIAFSSLELTTFVAAQEATSAVLSETSNTQFDGDDAATDEERARGGAMFFARVVAVLQIRKENEGTPDDPFPLIIYAVDVEKSLGDDISGRVNISFYDPRLQLTRKETSGPLSDDERYLFFPGALSSRNAYPVSLDDGFIPVRDDQHVKELIANFEPLIWQAEREERVLQAQLAKSAIPQAARK